MDKRYMQKKLVSEPFHDIQLLADIWGEKWGVKNGINPIRRILVHRPGEEVLQLHDHMRLIEAGPVLSEEIKGMMPGEESPGQPPDLQLMQQQHDSLCDVLGKEGIEVIYLEHPFDGSPESLFTRDVGMVVPGGVILSRLALYIRYGETRRAQEVLGGMGMPLLGMVHGQGFAEGGSFIMLDERTALIGRSERVNLSGIEQIRKILQVQGIELLVIDLPSTIIHLDEAFLMVDHDKALVNTALLPFWFLDVLHQRGIRMLHVDPRDHPLTINALTVAPGKVIFSSLGKWTMELLDRFGVEVIPVDVSEMFKLGGGIHCLTLPLIREM